MGIGTPNSIIQLMLIVGMLKLFTHLNNFLFLKHYDSNKMTQTIYVKFSYESKVSELVAIHTQLDLSKNSSRTRLLNRLLKSVPEGTEVSLPKMNNVLYNSQTK